MNLHHLILVAYVAIGEGAMRARVFALPGSATVYFNQDLLYAYLLTQPENGVEDRYFAALAVNFKQGNGRAPVLLPVPRCKMIVVEPQELG